MDHLQSMLWYCHYDEVMVLIQEDNWLYLFYLWVIFFIKDVHCFCIQLGFIIMSVNSTAVCLALFNRECEFYLSYKKLSE